MDGLDVDPVVLLAPPCAGEVVTDDLASRLHLTPRTRAALRREIARRFHVCAWNRLGMSRYDFTLPGPREIALELKLDPFTLLNRAPNPRRRAGVSEAVVSAVQELPAA